MEKYTFFALLILAVTLAACSPKSKPEDPSVWKKIKFDLSRLDENGLAGPPDGKVAVSYEFCIPADETKWREVQKIDGTAQKNSGKGRIGCTSEQWLVIGSTHQKNHRRVLYELAALPYLQEIREVFFE
jgi:hypothetical protein